MSDPPGRTRAPDPRHTPAPGRPNHFEGPGSYSHGHPEDHEHHYDGGHTHHHDGPGHVHATGLRGWLRGVFVPHSHDVADSIDDALEASSLGIRVVKTSLVLLGATAVVQLIIVAVSGSVALLADTIHNFSDALTAVPLWFAFVLGRRAATRRYTYGYGRAEDLAGLFIVVMIAGSAVLAGWESVDRLVHPQPLSDLGWVLAAGIIGFVGNEAVAVYRIRAGSRIGSAALVADGVHARIDGFTSLAVVAGAIGVWAGFPRADPIVGLLITVAIVILLRGTIRDVGRRLLDGVDPELTIRAEQATRAVAGVLAVQMVRLRWSGHRLHAQAVVGVDHQISAVQAHTIAERVSHRLRHELPNLTDAAVQTVPITEKHPD